MKDIFDHMRKPKPYLSECLVTKIKKRTKQLLKTFEYATRNRLTNFENLTFSLAFIMSS